MKIYTFLCSIILLALLTQGCQQNTQESSQILNYDTKGEPGITQLRCPYSVKAGDNLVDAISVVIQSKNGGNFFLRSTSTGLGIIPEETANFEVKSTEPTEVKFSINYPISGKQDKAVEVKFEACSSTELSQFCAEPRSCLIVAKS